jgi:hypothetical protein
MQKFEDLINKDKYQVFVFYCPAYFPFNYFRHPWFVLNKKGEISRWEIRHYINKKILSYLFVDYQTPFEGTNMTYLINKKWDASLLGSVEDDMAAKVIDFIEDSPKNYPYCKKYSYIGPNSNTYIQRVLSKFPEFNIKLSNRFIGKDFHV